MSRKSENIKVVVRCRPINKKELDAGHKQIVQIDHQRGVVSLYKGGIDVDKDPKTFRFNAAFPWDCTQQLVYDDAARPIVDAVLEGFNGTIFAYGQTGSGKTHTILGPAAQDGALADDPAALGLLPRTLGYMFDEIRRRETQDNVHYSCFVSFMEIYNEKIRDLLNPSNAKKLNIFWILSFFSITLAIRETASKDHRMTVENLSIMDVSSAADARHFVEQGLVNRRVGVTNMNMRSSRSHAVFTLYLTCEVGACNCSDVGSPVRHYCDTQVPVSPY